MFDARVHECSAPLLGGASAALDVARTALLSLGFEIVAESESQLSARGPGLHSNHQPALLGASELSFQVTPASVDARATLGGVATLKAFLYVFPPGLALVLMLGFAAMGMGVLWQTALAVAPWLVLSPWLAASIERKTTQAVERLVHGMAGAPARPS
ncbi:MAG: hypothetical protein JRH16_05760 [Deltaproteobacteria bacterium]|nr:hypothetical protein [Deltaproteobacteria bacterium]MBW2361362.1 hypothetical protein [Deltaproteobacteria bacterium]